MLAYYNGAFSRSFWGAVDWAIGQGWLLSLLLAIGVVVNAVAYSIIRAWRGHQSWRDAMNDISGRLKDFVFAFIGGSIVVLLGFSLFSLFPMRRCK